MRRREFIASFGGAITTWSLAAYAQQTRRARRIGVLINLSENDVEARPRAAALEKSLRELGWDKDRNLQIDYRWAAGDAALIRSYAAELVRLGADVFVANGTPAAAALKAETPTLPIVFVHVGDPVAYGFAASLARPSGNMTGFTLLEFSVGGKWLEILKAIAQNITRVGIMFNPEFGLLPLMRESIKAAAPSFAVESIELPVRSVAEIDQRCQQIAASGNWGIIVMPDPFSGAHREAIVSTISRHRLCAVYPFRYFAINGGLVSFGAESIDPFERAGVYVGRILNGEMPADLPVQQPTKFELVINLKTARALGLTIPPTLLARADEVIE